MSDFSLTSLTEENKNSSDNINSDAAVTQLKKNLSPYFITGFIDAEASFSLILSKNSQYKQGWLVFPVFQISLHKKDRVILEAIQNYFNGIGSIFIEEKRNSVKYRVASFKDISLIMEHLDKYPLITQKLADYLLFKQAMGLINCKAHLTLEGLKQIVNIRAAMNNGLTDVLKKEFPDLTPIARPLIQNQKIIDPNWLAGFTTGEGCFFIDFSKSVTHKNGYSIVLKFVLTQHIRDVQLMESLISYLGCGKSSHRLNYAEFTVTRFAQISEIILPFFEKYPVLGVKAEDFRSFCQAAKIMSNKAHLTKEGFEQILNIKKGMNKGRILEKEGSISKEDEPRTGEKAFRSCYSSSSKSTSSDVYPDYSLLTRTVKTKGYSKSSLPLINKEDYEILYGLILGDLFISRKNSENAYLRFEQSILHKEYLEHLFEEFNYLCSKTASIKTANRKLFNTSSVYFTTRQLTAITELHTLFYPNGIKRVPFNIGSLITEKSLAYWAMDDGNNHNSGYILNTSGFTLEDVKLLQAALYDNWALNTSIHSRNRFYINNDSKNKFLELIRPHFHSSMLYKIN